MKIIKFKKDKILNFTLTFLYIISIIIIFAIPLISTILWIMYIISLDFDFINGFGKDIYGWQSDSFDRAMGSDINSNINSWIKIILIIGVPFIIYTFSKHLIRFYKKNKKRIKTVQNSSKNTL